MSERRRNDKIFNNRYKRGEGYRSKDEEYSIGEIKVDLSYSSTYLNELYDYESIIDYKVSIKKIYELIQDDDYLKSFLEDIRLNKKIKVSKEDISNIFNRILEIIKKDNDNDFYKLVYIMDVVASIIGVDKKDYIKIYKKIFDSLDTDIQELLLIELDEKYNFINNNKNNMH